METLGTIIGIAGIAFLLWRLIAKSVRGANALRQSDVTVEAPLAPGGQEVLDAAARKMRRGASLTLVIVLAIILVVAAISGASVKDIRLFFLIFGGVGGFAALTIGGLTWHKLAQIRADRAEAVVLRTTGPIGASAIRSAYYLDLADRSLSVPSEVANAIADGLVGTVEYTPRARLVLSIRKLNGKAVYRL